MWKYVDQMFTLLRHSRRDTKLRANEEDITFKHAFDHFEIIIQGCTKGIYLILYDIND